MRARLTAIVALVVVLVGACGVTSSKQASTASGDDVPYGLLEERPGPSTTASPASSRTAEVWFVAGEGIVPLEREIPTPGIEAVVDALLAGPTEDESARGIRSALAGLDAVVDADVVSGVAVIGLSAGFSNAGPREQLFGLAQLVYTATSLLGVEVVTFELDGVPVEVPRADGSVASAPVTRLDYQALAPA